MIHHWECKRCTHTWTSCCFQEFFEGKSEDREYMERCSRQLGSSLCWDCFEMLESGELAGMEIFNLYHHLDTKSSRYGGHSDGRYTYQSQYSGMCHEHLKYENGVITYLCPFESGTTAEHKQLQEIESDIHQIYLDIIKEHRTAARIQLDEYRDSIAGETKEGEPSAVRVGWILCGSAPKPEGFVPDPPGKVREGVRWGYDVASGTLLAPHKVSENGIEE